MVFITINVPFPHVLFSDFEMDQMLVMGGGTMLGGMQQGMLSSVNLGEMLQVMADRTENFQKLLVEPRSVVSLMTDNHCFVTICHSNQFFLRTNV